jgi:hypothetical protein
MEISKRLANDKKRVITVEINLKERLLNEKLRIEDIFKQRLISFVKAILNLKRRFIW